MSNQTGTLYIRKSKKSVDGETVSLEFQERELRNLMTRHGVSVGEVFIDDGKSGAKSRQRWLDWHASFARHGVAGVWAIDRSSRQSVVKALYPLLMALEVHGTRLLTVRDRLDSKDPRFERDIVW